MEVGLVRSVDIDHEMQQAYLDYAMSVIVARALPDARDGLKPVHRRILYAMFDMGLRPDSSFKKSARIVGEVLGKYHPHGDMAVYEAMARMAQDFSMRCMLVEGQGNFGSVDGDPPAAMRYTEARLAAPAMHLLADIRKNTVDFNDNFDGSLTEPDVLPAAIPNLLVNGATGIAVGMSTNIPPHNLGEVVDALTFMLDHWEKLDDINIENLMQFIQGPDFPTGGIIVQGSEEEDLTAAYGSGRGKVTVQARAHAEEMSRGRNRIIITEIPFMTNKSSLIERIAELAREDRLEGIADLRDESDRQGLRIVIELNKTAEPEAVLQELYKNTPLRSTFGIIMLALVDGEPRMLSLKQALRVYLDHRLEVIRRRSEFDLERARQRAHILEGLRVALKNLDEVISIIRRAPDADNARQRLMKRFKLSEVQANAILDMPLRRLAALERKKIEDEYKEVQALIKELMALLRSPRRMRELVANELNEVKAAYGERRRTQIVQRSGNGKAAPLLTASDLVPEHTVWISATTEGLVSRTLDDKPPRLSGNAAPMWTLQANTRDTLFLVTELGEAAAIPVHALAEVEKPEEGIPAHRVSALSESDRLAALFTLPMKDERDESWFVLTATSQGMVKKSALSEFPGPTARTFTLTRVNEGDRLVSLRLTDGKADILLATKNGMAIRFAEDDVRGMGLVAAGVNGIKLQAGDEVVGMDVIPSRGEILMIASDGKAKRIAPNQFPVQGRYGQGVVAWKLPRTAQLVGLVCGKGTTRLTLHLDKLAPKMIRLDDAPLQTRAAGGKPVQELKAGDQIIAVTVPWEAPRPLASQKAVPVESTPQRTARSRSRSASRPAPTSKTTSRQSKTTRQKADTPARSSTSPRGGSKSGTSRKPSARTKTASTGEDAGDKPTSRTRSRSTSKTTPATKPASRTRARSASQSPAPESKPTSRRSKAAPKEADASNKPAARTRSGSTSKTTPAAKPTAKRSSASQSASRSKPTARQTKTTPKEADSTKKPAPGSRTKTTGGTASPKSKSSTSRSTSSRSRTKKPKP